MRYLLFAAPFLLSACGGAAEEKVAQDSDFSPDELAVSTAAAGDQQLLDLQLGGAGLELIADDDFADLVFGTSRADTELALAPQIGEPEERGSNDECPAGKLEYSQYPGLTLYFQDGAFVGWFADDAPYLTMQTRGELAQIAEMVPDITIGEEFTMGDEDNGFVSGIFSGTEEDAAVDNMWAGTNCIFR